MLHNQKNDPLELAALLDAHAIAHAFAHATIDWHLPRPTVHTTTLPLQLHRANFDLWHQEDQARDPQATDHQIASVKHAIDQINQHRNDLVEQLDQALLNGLAPHQLPDPAAALHSETPGLILDRLSILSLKLFHTREESQRTTATAAHRQRNAERLLILQQQSEDLTACLDALWSEILQSRRRFKLYRQLKMYNDPTLNPVLYQHKPL